MESHPRRHRARSATGLADWLFGGTCYLCRGASNNGVLCAPCSEDLPRLPQPRCPRCALPVATATVCGRCLSDPPAYDATVAVFDYAFPVDTLIQGLKFRGELALAPLLGDLLVDEIAAETMRDIGLVIPAPMHADRVAQRGFNQSMEIARSIAAQLRIPLSADLCTRVRATPAQIELPWKGRRDNVRGAFRCRRAPGVKAVAVVDDVMTTGATMNEIAATLKDAGATRVVNWVVARTTIE